MMVMVYQSFCVTSQHLDVIINVLAAAAGKSHDSQ